MSGHGNQDSDYFHNRATTTPSGEVPEPTDEAKDAARYRWLRDVGDATWRPFGIREGYSAAQADAAIDAAMSRSRAQGDTD